MIGVKRVTPDVVSADDADALIKAAEGRAQALLGLLNLIEAATGDEAATKLADEFGAWFSDFEDFRKGRAS